MESRDRILLAVKKIPRGYVCTYGAIASKAKTSPRAVGAVMRANRDPTVPCHRVVCSNASIGGFNRGIKTKIKLLKSEGIVIKDGYVSGKHFLL